jgi:hypothetical protein
LSIGSTIATQRLGRLNRFIARFVLSLMIPPRFIARLVLSSLLDTSCLIVVVVVVVVVSYKKEEKKLGLGGLLIGTLLVYILYTMISCCPLLSLACFDIFILSSCGENFTQVPVNVGGNNNYETIELKDPCVFYVYI